MKIKIHVKVYLPLSLLCLDGIYFLGLSDFLLLVIVFVHEAVTKKEFRQW